MPQAFPVGLGGEARTSATADHVIPRFTLQCGTEIESLHLRYQVHGELNVDGSNAVLCPTWFAGRHTAATWLTGPGRALDPNRWCVIVVNALGNGESSSPSSHHQLSVDGAPVPISLLDNVRAQRALMEALGVHHLHAVIGRSMGAQQALQWCCFFPEMVGGAFVFCGSPRTSAHNRLILEGMEVVLEQGLSTQRHEECLITAARIYAAWSLSHGFHERQLWRASAKSAEEWIMANIVANFAHYHPMDLLSLVRTWKNADIAENSKYGGDLEAALRAITAPVLLVPISRDQIFPPDDFRMAAALIQGARMQPLDSDWGHRAGAPGSDPDDIAGLEHAMRIFVTDPVGPGERMTHLLGQLWPF